MSVRPSDVETASEKPKVYSTSTLIKYGAIVFLIGVPLVLLIGYGLMYLGIYWSMRSSEVSIKIDRLDGESNGSVSFYKLDVFNIKSY